MFYYISNLMTVFQFCVILMYLKPKHKTAKRKIKNEKHDNSFKIVKKTSETKGI